MQKDGYVLYVAISNREVLFSVAVEITHRHGGTTKFSGKVCSGAETARAIAQQDRDVG